MKTISQEIQNCIDACNDCLIAAKKCLTTHMGEEDMKTCHLLCLDCLAVCAACVQVLAGQSDFSSRICSVCAELCHANRF